MLYDVTLKIDYSYSQPTNHTRNLLRLLPRDIPGMQTIHDWTLALSPRPSEQSWFTDFFRNPVTSTAWHAPIEEVKIALTFRAERLVDAPGLLMSSPLSRLPADLTACRDPGPDSPLHFTAPSRRAPLVPAITAFAREHLSPGMTSMEAVEAIGRAIHVEMTYSAEATDVDTPVETAFEARAGVCQDFSHIMIAALRGIGVPSAYVSGFLRTYPPPGKEKLVGVDAMHAWVRAWVGPELGWLEFDPTNNQFASVDYIVIGYGRDYDDVAPVRGSMRGAGDQDSEQSVDVAVVE